MPRPGRVLLVGTGSQNADFLADVLNSQGIEASWTDKVKFPSPFLIRKFDVVYGIYLQTCSRYLLVAKTLRKKIILHFIGSDAYWFARENSIWRRAYWGLVLNVCDVILYVSPHLEELTGHRGIVLPFPIQTEKFRNVDLLQVASDRDILYYCPSGSDNERIYRLSWIVDYAKTHPEENITIIGNVAHPANYKISLPNVQIISYVNHDEMPLFYRRHRRLIRMTTEDGGRPPRMILEALLCGIKVIYNGEEIEDVPRGREPRDFATEFSRVLKSLRAR